MSDGMPGSRPPAPAPLLDAQPGAGATSRLVADTEPALYAFLKTRINSFIKWDLAHFFHANPHAADTADNIARYIGRSPEEVRLALEELTQAGLAAAQSLGGLSVYSLTDEAEARALLARFVEACADRQFRVRAIYYLVRSGKE
jgi:hypothetical protein